MNPDELAMICIALRVFSSLLRDAGMDGAVKEYDDLIEKIEGKGE